MTDNTEGQALPGKKKSVALSGTAAGNTAVCTVGRTGNDLHYRGYDILEFAATAEFEEIAHLLIHEWLPMWAELTAYKDKLKFVRGRPAVLKGISEQIPVAYRHVCAPIRPLTEVGLGGPHHRAAAGSQDHRAERQLCRAREPSPGADRSAIMP